MLGWTTGTTTNWHLLGTTTCMPMIGRLLCSVLDAMGKGGGGLEPGPYLLGARFSLADVRLCADVYARSLRTLPACRAYLRHRVACVPEAQGSVRG